MRLPRALVPALALALAVVAAFADRALVGQAEAARAAAVARIDEDARLAVQAVRAALVALEQAAAAGRADADVTLERLCVPPPRSVAPRGSASYASRSRADLAELLSSTRATPNGLPEAVVARLALGPASPVSGAAGTAAVEARLLAGELPVRPEDLSYLADRLGLKGDPRLPALVARLRAAPDPARLPPAPGFRRRLASADRVEGWSRAGDRLLRYELPVARVLERAGVAERAAVEAALSRPAGATAPASRTVAVPDVDGLFLIVTPRLPGAVRLAALRAVLWLSAAAGVAGLFVVRRALAREEKAMARERAFLSGVTHELRTPLTTIRVLGETLAEGRGEPREYGTLVAQESQRLEALVERVLALTRVEQRPRFSSADPGALLRSAVAVVQPRAERRSTRIECHVEPPLPECRWDGDAVRRALLNLLDNAVAHGRPGGRVRATASASGREVSLSVSDDGPGIVRADRRRIFGRFERGTTDAPGTGLGLYLVEEVARAHGGRVDLVTAEGRGSTFALVLPARPEAAGGEATG
jgi:two-component system, OmpR family, phosphate regulon sensor histidine kinase PhoR